MHWWNGNFYNPLLQILDLSSWPRRAEHASPLATWSKSSPQNYWGGWGQLPRNLGKASYRASAQSVPCSVDSGGCNISGRSDEETCFAVSLTQWSDLQGAVSLSVLPTDPQRKLQPLEGCFDRWEELLTWLLFWFQVLILVAAIWVWFMQTLYLWCKRDCCANGWE